MSSPRSSSDANLNKECKQLSSHSTVGIIQQISRSSEKSHAPSSNHFNELRRLCKYQKDENVDRIIALKNIMSKSQFINLLKEKNYYFGISGATIIQYAVKYNNDHAIHELLSDLSVEERFDILQVPFKTGCNALHFAASLNDSSADGVTIRYQAAKAIKQLLFTESNHHYWKELLATTQDQLESPVHYAARHPSSEVLQLFSEGLTSTEWLAIISQKNERDDTALDIILINRMKGNANSLEFIIIALKGSLTDEQWVDFLLSQNICRALRYSIPGGENQHKLYDMGVKALTKNLSETHLSKLETLLKNPFQEPAQITATMTCHP